MGLGLSGVAAGASDSPSSSVRLGSSTISSALRPLSTSLIGLFESETGSDFGSMASFSPQAQSGHCRVGNDLPTLLPSRNRRLLVGVTRKQDLVRPAHQIAAYRHT